MSRHPDNQWSIRRDCGLGEGYDMHASSIEKMSANPVGHYVLGPTYVSWCSSPTLHGTVHWGRPSEQDLRELMRLFDLVHASPPSHDFIMDAAGLDAFDWLILAKNRDVPWTRAPEWIRRIRRLALVLPPGPIGTIVSEMSRVASPRVPSYPLRLCATRAEAVTWLDRCDAREAVGKIDRIVEHCRRIAPVVRRLREYLDHSLVSPNIGEAARACALAPRTLQRELRQQGTSFSVELASARLRAACALLVASDDKVDAIARKVGCQTASRLSELFRRVMRQTPTQYRSQHRG